MGRASLVFDVTFNEIPGAASYTAAVTSPDGSFVDYGAIGAGSGSILVPYVGNGTYTYETSASNVNVYVIDTGIRATHTEFGGRVSADFTALNDGTTPRTVKVSAGETEFDAVVRIDTPGEADYYRNGGILQYVLRNMLKTG